MSERLLPRAARKDTLFFERVAEPRPEGSVRKVDSFSEPVSKGTARFSERTQLARGPSHTAKRPSVPPTTPGALG